MDATKIKKLRLEKGYTQKQLAEKAGMSQPYLHQIETGKHPMTLRILNRLADALGVPAWKLMKD